MQRLLAEESFGKREIQSVKTSGAKLFFIKLQQEDWNESEDAVVPKHLDISVIVNGHMHIGFGDVEEKFRKIQAEIEKRIEN